MNIFVPGAGLIGQDNRGRSVWKMPDPQNIARHFNSAASKAKYFSIEAEESDEDAIQQAYNAATHVVPIYRGYDQALMSYFMRQARRVQLKAKAKAEKGIEVSEDELER